MNFDFASSSMTGSWLGAILGTQTETVPDLVETPARV